jgi:hypothetical protein
VVCGLQPILDISEKLCHAQAVPISAEAIETCGAGISTFARKYFCVLGSQTLGKRVDVRSEIRLAEFLITGRDGSAIKRLDTRGGQA